MSLPWRWTLTKHNQNWFPSCFSSRICTHGNPQELKRNRFTSAMKESRGWIQEIFGYVDVNELAFVKINFHPRDNFKNFENRFDAPQIIPSNMPQQNRVICKLKDREMEIIPNLKPSSTRRKRKGDSESPCPNPLFTWKSLVGLPFTSTDIELEEKQVFIHLIHSLLKPTYPTYTPRSLKKSNCTPSQIQPWIVSTPPFSSLQDQQLHSPPKSQLTINYIMNKTPTYK